MVHLTTWCEDDVLAHDRLRSGYIGCFEDKLPDESCRGSNLKNPGVRLLLVLHGMCFEGGENSRFGRSNAPWAMSSLEPSRCPKGLQAARESRSWDASFGEQVPLLRWSGSVIRMIFGLIFWAFVTLTVLAATFIPLLVVSLFALTVLIGDDSLVNPLVVYGIFPTAVVATAYLMYRYGRQIADFVQFLSP